jgi:hypothetical protein
LFCAKKEKDKEKEKEKEKEKKRNGAEPYDWATKQI